MKKGIALLLALLVMFALCACGGKEQANSASEVETSPKENVEVTNESSSSNLQEDKSVDEKAPDGYFRILHTTMKDAFGEESEGPEYIVAIAEATNNSTNNTYEVALYYNYSGGFSKNDHNFYFYTPYKGGVLTVGRVDFKIGDEKDYFVLHEDNYAYEDVDPDIYEFLKQCFIDGEDITFSVSRGQFIFTIHGEGFADLVASVEEQTEESAAIPSAVPAPATTEEPAAEETVFKWNEPQSILYGMVGIVFENDPSFSLGQYGFLATANVKDVDTLMTLISGDLSNRGFDDLIPFIKHTMENGKHSYQDGIHVYFNEDWSTGSNHYAVTYENDGQVALGLYSDTLEGITHYFKGTIE